MNHWSRGTPTCQDGSHTSEWLYRPDYLVLCCPLLAAFCFTSNTPDPLKTGLKVIRKVDCRYPRNLVYSNSPFLLHFLFVFSSETVTEQETRFFFSPSQLPIRDTDKLCGSGKRRMELTCVQRHPRLGGSEKTSVERGELSELTDRLE